MKTYLNHDDFGILAVCALRYAAIRKTEVPDAVIGIVREHIRELKNEDIIILWRDCERQRQTGRYGDPVVDKPSWLMWAEIVKAEKARRGL